MDKSSTTRLIDQATALLAVTRQLDYLKILKHDQHEVAKLRSLLGGLNEGGAGMAHSAPKPVASEAGKGSDDDSSQREMLKANRQMAILEQLTIEGFSDRLGRVYNSRSEERSMEFRKVPHHKNLPEFDMIVSADYSPGEGVHGIIMTEHHVMSVFLAAPGEQNEWETLKSRSYDNMEEMGEYVTLMSAGFDLP